MMDNPIVTEFNGAVRQAVMGTSSTTDRRERDRQAEDQLATKKPVATGNFFR